MPGFPFAVGGPSKNTNSGASAVCSSVRWKRCSARHFRSTCCSSAVALDGYFGYFMPRPCGARSLLLVLEQRGQPSFILLGGRGQFLVQQQLVRLLIEVGHVITGGFRVAQQQRRVFAFNEVGVEARGGSGRARATRRGCV